MPIENLVYKLMNIDVDVEKPFKFIFSELEAYEELLRFKNSV
jgi:hypothetical protein